MTKKQQRMTVLVASLILMGGAVAVILWTLRDNIVFFKTPSDLMNRPVTGAYERLGGLVEQGSLKTNSDDLSVIFGVSDGHAAVNVRFKGIVPQLFRENQGVVVEGRYQPPYFEAEKLFVKHDESYRPPTALELENAKGAEEKRAVMVQSLEEE
ncbi:MAG: cytochrome c maturation protein CcmE [Candidatus Nucleicultricaceae bacterium]